MGSYSPVQSVLRALNVLRAVNACDANTLDGIARTTGLPKPTVVRLLETLCIAGYVEKDESQRKYRVTSLVSALSEGVRFDVLISEAGTPVIRDLTDCEKWPFALAVRKQEYASVCASTLRQAPYAPRFPTGRSSNLSLVAHGLGRAYLAFCAPDECDSLIETLASSGDPIHALAQQPKDLKVMLRRIRDAGFAERDPRIQPQTTSTIAVPITSGNSVIATLGLTYFRSAINRRQLLDRYVPLLHQAAERVRDKVETLRPAGPAVP